MSLCVHGPVCLDVCGCVCLSLCMDSCVCEHSCWCKSMCVCLCACRLYVTQKFSDIMSCSIQNRNKYVLPGKSEGESTWQFSFRMNFLTNSAMAYKTCITSSITLNVFSQQEWLKIFFFKIHYQLSILQVFRICKTESTVQSGHFLFLRTRASCTFVWGGRVDSLETPVPRRRGDVLFPSLP